MKRFAVAVLAVAALVNVSVSDDEKSDSQSEPKVKAKGFLPQNWKDLSLTDEQKQKVYTIQNKYNDDIDKLDAKIKDLKAKMAKERLEVLTADQKKKLAEIMRSKAGVAAE